VETRRAEAALLGHGAMDACSSDASVVRRTAETAPITDGAGSAQIKRLSPDRRFRHRPAATAQPFDRTPPLEYDFPATRRRPRRDPIASTGSGRWRPARGSWA
jgi:hypothetical protein